MKKRTLFGSVLALLATISTLGAAALSAQQAPFANEDVFEIEYASDVQISPDASTVAYVRYAMSIMRDRREGRLWLVDTDGSNHRKLTSEDRSESSPRWSPDGTRIADRPSQLIAKVINTVAWFDRYKAGTPVSQQ